MRYRMANDESIEAKPTKFDDCTLAATGKPYKFQKGSGRSMVIALAVDGMPLGTLAAMAGKLGFTSDFAVDCAWKQHTTADGAWKVEPPSGMTMAEVKARKNVYILTPEQEQAAKDREDDKAKAKSARELAKTQKAEAAAASRAAKADAAIATRMKARQDAADAAAATSAASAAAGGNPAEGTSAVVSKGKGKGKAKPPAGSPEATGVPAEEDTAF